MGSSVVGLVECDLYNPSLGCPSTWVELICLLIYLQENILDYVFRLAAVVQNAVGDGKHKSRVAIQKKIQCGGIPRAETRHYFLVVRDPPRTVSTRHFLGRICLRSVPKQRKIQPRAV